MCKKLNLIGTQFRLPRRVSEKYRNPHVLLSKDNNGERNFFDGLRCGVFLLIAFSLICFAQPLHAQEIHPWTVMVYMSADNDSIDTAMSDLQKMIDVSAADTEIAIVVLLDNSDDASYFHYGIVDEATTDASTWYSNNSR